jgi:PBP1b-binding outer membrane lipoprotein LpoB
MKTKIVVVISLVAFLFSSCAVVRGRNDQKEAITKVILRITKKPPLVCLLQIQEVRERN